MTAIRGHEREELITWLRAANAFTAIAPALDCTCSACKARNAVLDPAVLAEILSETLRGFGVDVGTYVGAWQWHGTYKTEWAIMQIWPPERQMIVYQHKLFVREGELSMPAARALLLRLLQLPEGTTSADALREVEAR